jgi:serine protease AprX
MNTKFFRHSLRTILVAITVIATLVVTSGTVLVNATPGQAYIVQGHSTSAVAEAVTRNGGLVTAQLDLIHAVAATLSPESVAALRAEAAVTAISQDAVVKVADDGDDQGDGNEEAGLGAKSPATDYPDVVGADVVWQKGTNGSGVTVAIVDTGLALHRGLMRGVDGKLRNRVVAWQDFVDGKRLMRDPNGHGTHIAGVIANSQKGTDGEWNGVAPGVKLVAVRVLDETGAGTYTRVIQGIQWVVEHKDKYNIRVMNLSLVSPVQSPYWADPLDLAVMQAWAHGIVVVVAAGNGGPAPMTVGVPANTPYAVTVGAFTDNFTPADWSDDYIAPFSAAGPTLDGFVKPDLVAPGAHIVSTMLPKSYIAKNHQASQVANQYFSMAGTSQAAAVTSGIAALILSKNPGLTPDQVKYRLTMTSMPWLDVNTDAALYSMWQQGAGRVNAPDAVFANVQGSANAGLDIQADLAGTLHFEGFTEYDQNTGTFHLRGDLATWDGKYGVWNGKYGVWNGKYGVWNGGYGVWNGKYGVWNGGYGVWNGGYGVWNGGYGVWNGGYGVWNGGYGVWNGGYGVWNGSEPWIGSVYATPAFVQNFLDGVSPSATANTTFINNWVDEPSKH